MSIESVMPFSHLILCRPLLLLPPILPSIRVFSNESTLCMKWPKYCSFSFSIIPSKEYPGLIFRMDRLDLLAVQGTLKSLLLLGASVRNPARDKVMRKEASGSTIQFSSVKFSHSVMSDSLQPHESQHVRPPCPLPSPGVHSNSHPSSR